LSDAGRPQAASGAVPALSNAYPLYRENPPPGYPELARQQGYEGVVLVAAEILADGRVGKALVSKSSGYAILDQSAVKAVKKWKFEPAKKAGVPCKTWAELPIKFVINDHHSQS
jgi:protein TonB